MLKVNIKNKQYLLPESIQEVSLERGIIKERLEEEYNNIPDYNILDYKKDILGVLMDVSTDILDEVLDSQIELVYNNLYYLDNISVYFSRSFTIRGIDYCMIDLENLTLYDYSEIESYLQDDLWDNITNILAILYRPVTKKSYSPISLVRRFISRFFNKQAIAANYSEYNNTRNYTDYKEFKNDYINRASIFYNHLNYATCKAMLCNYIEYKTNLLEEFNLLREVYEDDDEEEKGLHIGKIKDVSERFGIYHQLQIISNNNILELEHWKQQTIKSFFLKLYYMMQVQKEIDSKHKK